MGRIGSGRPEEGTTSTERQAPVHVLMLDPDSELVATCAAVIRATGCEVRVAGEAEAALRILEREAVDVLFLPEEAHREGGPQLLERVRGMRPELLAIVTAEDATADGGLRALQAGAWEYLPKPFTATSLLILVRRAAHALEQTRNLHSTWRRDGILIDGVVRLVGVSAAMRDAVATAIKVASTNASVFITGESGTGKELIARCVHEHSPRAAKPFVAINCAAFPTGLLESELFGHTRGAFTGAVRDRPGLLESAHGGTLFLDELAEMPVELQAKLLRVLQDGVIRRVGSTKEDARVDLRVISATNRQPEQALAQGALRPDLYYRLRVVPIHLPPLRQRREDISALVAQFLDEQWRLHHRPDLPRPRLSAEAFDALMSHDWPGNVRELRNVIEHLAVLGGPGEIIAADRLAIPAPEPESGSRPQRRAWSMNFSEAFHHAKQRLIEQFEREYLARLVGRSEGNMSEAARQAGIDRTTLYRLMDKHRMSRDAFTG